ncbi:right-handed parallel beta-helix repeat-containing protein [Coraliomargarita sp. SDUM461004]|uniref:Right-handed parallel beta-helix repeat-containing protein n=1 Tax=Thalassobacterium sedimentorum TaxID=3041258 RepID=A0ABU1AE09_9BACT|nr:right-handed parallel beta-helix repeat-containing protein [Coraliomargarita sp. SDUM461004]MDQ8192957.1 right-handed parallel beta-helix repeat-containing protein [Coraliomargarita sp. SDUM461004]
MNLFLKLLRERSLLVALIYFSLGAVLSGASIYVSPNGDDSDDGSVERPFASLQRAQEAVREMLAEQSETESYRIHVAAGIYHLETSLKFGSVDSGRKGATVIWKGDPNGGTILTGGVGIQLSDLKPVEDAQVLGRIPVGARDQVLSIDLRAIGFEHLPEMPLYGHSMSFLNVHTEWKTGIAAPELYYNGIAQTSARWPNQEEGFARIDEVIRNGTVIRNWMDDMKGSDGGSYVEPEDREDPPVGFSIRVEGDRAKRWQDAEDARLYGFWYWDWSDQSVQLKSVDPQSGVLNSWQPSAYGVRAGQRFYVYNLLEELDQPGEWYLDRNTGILYLYPPDDNEDALIQLSVLGENLIELEEASHIEFDSFQMELSRRSGMSIQGGQGCRITRCTFQNLGGTAVVINGGAEHVLRDSTLRNLSAGAVIVTGGDRQTLEASKHRVENNLIHSFARVRKTYTPAIQIGGVGQKIVHNEIHDGPHAGIIFAGNDHLIEYNEIYDVVNQAQDMGAIYAGRDLTARGNRIRSNYIHDIPLLHGGHAHMVYGIYLDDLFSGTEVSGNIFQRVPTGVMINGGRNTLIENNVFVWDWNNVSYSPVLLTTWGLMPSNRSHWATHAFGLKEDPRRDDVELQAGNAVPWDSEIYGKYPELSNILEDEPKLPKYNVIRKNVVVQGNEVLRIWLRTFDDDLTLSDIRGLLTIEDNLVTQPDSNLFKDIKSGDFNLSKGSRIYSQIPDFQPIEFNLMGLLE